MEPTFIMAAICAVILTAFASYMTIKMRMDKMIAKMNEIRQFIKENMDVLPPEAVPIANDVISLLDEIEISFKDGKISYGEVMSMFKKISALYKNLKKIYDEKIVG